MLGFTKCITAQHASTDQTDLLMQLSTMKARNEE
jgi:hypothetical protein